MEEKGQVIIFKDLLESQFNGDYDDMLDWLNKYNCNKKVIFITPDGKIVQRSGHPYIVRKYRQSEIINLVLITMTSGVDGYGKGLFFINRDFVGKEDLNSDEDFGIKWYVNGQFVDDKKLKKN